MRSLAVAATGLLVIGLGSSVAWGDDSKQLFEKSCKPCHGASGKGDGPAAKGKNKPPDFAAALKGKSEADIVKFLKEGKPDLKPPHQKPKLTDEQLGGLAKYVKGL
jgi:mono/diheme cytochrome c family protein